MMQTNRAQHEIEHGKFLSSGNTELIWGWGTPAGQCRAYRRSELIVNAANIQPGHKVLEVGCGTGMFTEMFATTGANILAVDISSSLLEKARRRKAWPDHIQFIEKRFEECEVDGPFDAVVGSSILHHLEVEASLRKILALLKPGGSMAFAEPNMLNPQIFLQKNVPMIKRWMGDSPDEIAFVRWSLASLLSRVGFVDIQIIPFDWLHPATPRPFISTITLLGKTIEKIPCIREFSGSLLIRASRPRT